jgi:hypothetical protein
MRRHSRAAAEARYGAIRRAAFQAAEAELNATGIVVSLRHIDAAALAAVASWTNRRVDWRWAHAAPDWRGEILCGMALGRPSKGPSHLSIHFAEGNPDPAHPLRGKVLPIVLAAGLAYAIALESRNCGVCSLCRT